eukprot:TRINITY_DN7806_c0_g1_i4.p1 TRINITY_DN7806_c0_g1~~TRINITY_DN7806_c0_g1_i4.p1  ORF type:complete len:526 (+),score=104.25 TRINITY_DN7806_c0_g1_i4:179-1579(+)
MSPAEQRSLTIISSFSEFVTSQKLRSKDFFSKFTDGDSSSLNVSDLMRGCTFMCLGGTLRTSVSTAPPSLEEVQELFTLIDTDGGGRLEYAELDLVIKLVQERKARNSRQENIFLKDTPDMTATELAARDFFVPLYKEMESRGWTAKDFMNQYDSDAGGELSGRELISAAKDLGLTMNENVVNNFDRALMLLDRDFNGALNTQELENILRFVRDSTLDGDAAASSIPNPFAAEVQQAEASAEKQKESMFRVFGLKAFIECLLKIGFGFLSFHGSPEQSQLPSAAKVVWLLTYLQWQLDEKEVQEDEPLVGNEHAVDQKLTTALQVFGNRRVSLGFIIKDFAKRGFKPKTSALDSDEHRSQGPMQMLKEDNPDLFRQGPTDSPILMGHDLSLQETCSICGAEPINGWGNPSCSACGHGETILKACFQHIPDNLPVLNKVVTLLGTRTMLKLPLRSTSRQHVGSLDAQ